MSEDIKLLKITNGETDKLKWSVGKWAMRSRPLDTQSVVFFLAVSHLLCQPSQDNVSLAPLATLATHTFHLGVNFVQVFALDHLWNVFMKCKFLRFITAWESPRTSSCLFSPATCAITSNFLCTGPFFFCHTELLAVLYYLCCVDMAPSTQKIHLKISFVCLENSFILKISSHSSLSLSFSSLRKLSPTYQLKYISPLVRFHWILNTLLL